ncbi:MAG TPA: gluconate 2-dehydrogenase subunit 3 family protein, partial [Rhizobiales bacterium]|nr:gluconate 2-dehydrogenase subunit 3 family protein [Hyphomicrobiales bacterium]
IGCKRPDDAITPAGKPLNGRWQKRTGITNGGLPRPQWLIDRRKFLALAGAAGAAGLLPGWSHARPAPGRKFFTRHEFATLEEIAEMIIPKDDVSGGAKAAKVVDMIDIRIGESVDPEWKQSWRDDLEEIDRLSRKWTGRTFRRASRRQRHKIMRRISRNEANPKRDGEYAFGTIKWEVCDVYYRTEIGIHDDLKYQGNVILDEFVGTDVSGSPAFPDSPVREQTGTRTDGEVQNNKTLQSPSAKASPAGYSSATDKSGN